MSESAAITCSTVWGGNRTTDAALVLPGVAGWVSSRPVGGEPEGGDVHLVSSCGSGRITRVMLVDVFGHGASVAQVGQRLRAFMQRYLNHERPHRLVARLNRDMAELSATEGDRFATAVVLSFYAPSGRVSVCNAGHPPPLLYRAADDDWGPVHQPDTGRGITNLPLGVAEQVGYVGRELTLAPGDTLLLYTDGLIEARAADGELLTLDGLLAVLREIGPAEPASLAGTLTERIGSRGFALQDDTTVVVLRCTGVARHAGFGAMVGGTLRFLGHLRHPRSAPWPPLWR